MTKKEQRELKKLDLKFENIDYSKIPYTDAKPNKTTLEAINGPVYRIK